MVHWDMYINTGKVLFRLVRNIYIHYYYLYPTDQSLCRVFLSCQGLGGISTGFGTGCELSWVDNLFETVVDLADLTYSGREANQSFFSANFQPDSTTEVLTMPQEPICVAPGHASAVGENPKAGALKPVPCVHQPRLADIVSAPRQ